MSKRVAFNVKAIRDGETIVDSFTDDEEEAANAYDIIRQHVKSGTYVSLSKIETVYEDVT